MQLIRFFILLLSFFFSLDCYAIQEHWVKGFPNKRSFETPPAFEKVYVTREEIISLQDGIYLKKCCGQLEKVRALLEDCDGLYVLFVDTQCPLCGTCYKGKAPAEGMCCPIYENESRPFLY